MRTTRDMIVTVKCIGTTGTKEGFGCFRRFHGDIENARMFNNAVSRATADASDVPCILSVSVRSGSGSATVQQEILHSNDVKSVAWWLLRVALERPVFRELLVS